MNDMQLIEFLLNSYFFKDQLKVDDKIRIEPITAPLGSSFFKEMEKTGRRFTVLAGEVQFDCHQINKPNYENILK